MLNDFLYQRLKKAFGEVTVVKEGEKASLIFLPKRGGAGDRLETWTVEKNGGGGEQYVVNCPFCGDTGHHLYISHLSFACPKINGTVLEQSPLKAICYRHDCLRKERSNVLSLIHMIGSVLPENGENNVLEYDAAVEQQIPLLSNESTLEGIREWAPDYKEIDDSTPSDILNYLASRRVTEADVKRLQIGWGDVINPKTGKRIKSDNPFLFFPIVNNGKMRGIQARVVDVYSQPDFKMKYWFHPACRKSCLLYNMDCASAHKIVSVCEGVFDSLAIGPCSVATFGHTPSSYQRRLLETRWYRGALIWFPDTDSRPDLDPVQIALDQCGKWNAEGVFELGAHVVVLPKKDPGSMDRWSIWKEALRQVDNSKVSQEIVNEIKEMYKEESQ